MGTAEIIIVFSALMALVALVTIGIDWIAKPLKHRRFIPRMYRFEDEKLPMDAYGHTDFNVPEPAMASPAMMPPHQQPQPAPMVVAYVEQLPPQIAPDEHYGSPETVVVPAATPAAATTSTTKSAFSDSLTSDSSPGDSSPSDSSPGAPSDLSDAEAWLATGLVPTAGSARPSPARSDTGRSGTSRSGIASTISVPSMGAWKPGMALDETINDRKPNLATKAQRFWMSTVESLGESHFAEDNIARMKAGKAPRRNNPRTGRNETMQLTGLRQATQPSEARMRWLEEAVDPWNAT